jgi:phage terminase large subunit GpA-like protein
VSDIRIACSKCRNTCSLWLEFTSSDMRRYYYRCAACGYMSEVDNGSATVRPAREATHTDPKRPPPWWAG